VKNYFHRGKELIIDIGSGTGNFIMEISKHFSKSIGVDINEEMLNIARKKKIESNIEFLNKDMLNLCEISSKNSVDIAVCFGNTIVHLNNETEVESFFEEIRKILKPTGIFLFQIINYDNVLDNNLDSLPTIDNEEVIFERNYYLNHHGKIDFQTILTIKETGERIENSVELLPLRKKSLEFLLTKVGFNNIRFYSSFDKAEYSANSLQLIAECY